MKIIISLLACTLFLYSCNDSGQSTVDIPVKPHIDTAAPQKFFPVTSYFKGEIFNIKQSGINPLKYTTINNQTDSVWLKIEELEPALQDFLKPEIDSANLISLFTEKNFMDQSIDAITLTYEPKSILPDSMKLSRWDIYIDPKSNKVKRVYMVKEVAPTRTLQLTWVSNQWCKIISIVTNEKGESKIEKEEKIILDF